VLVTASASRPKMASAPAGRVIWVSADTVFALEVLGDL
jgi:hypothetical protein